MRVLVTGAGGFLGQRLVAALLQDGHTVRAMVRPNAPYTSAGGTPALEVFRADLNATPDLAPAFDDIDVLVHLAAAVTGDEQRMFADSVQGTERLLASMVGTCCRRIVLASTFAVYDWSNIANTLDEDSPLETETGLSSRGAYAKTKFYQERVTRRLASKHGWDLTVLRPGYIWGRGRADIAACCTSIGGFHFLIGPATRLPLTHVENCADLFSKAVTDPRAKDKTFNVIDGPGETIWAFVGDHLKLSGQGGIRVPVSYNIMLTMIKIMYAAGFKRLRNLPNLLIPRRFEARLKPLWFSDQRVREQMDWQAPLSYSECVSFTYQRERNIVPHRHGAEPNAS